MVGLEDDCEERSLGKRSTVRLSSWAQKNAVPDQLAKTRSGLTVSLPFARRPATSDSITPSVPRAGLGY